MKKLILILLLPIILPAIDAPGDVAIPHNPYVLSSATLRWNANSESDLSHYNVYYNFADTLINRMNVVDTSVVIELSNKFDNTFYEIVSFYVTAVDSSGNESNPSDTVHGLFAEQLTVRGDFDKDGKVLGSDIMQMYGSIGSVPGAANFQGTADVNGDGIITGADIMISRGYIGTIL